MKIPICRFKTIPNNQNYPFDIIFIHIFTLSAQNFPSFEDTNPIFVGSISSFAPEIQFFLVASPSCCLSQFLPLVHPDFCVFFLNCINPSNGQKNLIVSFSHGFAWTCYTWSILPICLKTGSSVCPLKIAQKLPVSPPKAGPQPSRRIVSLGSAMRPNMPDLWLLWRLRCLGGSKKKPWDFTYDLNPARGIGRRKEYILYFMWSPPLYISWYYIYIYYRYIFLHSIWQTSSRTFYLTYHTGHSICRCTWHHTRHSIWYSDIQYYFTSSLTSYLTLCLASYPTLSRIFWPTNIFSASLTFDILCDAVPGIILDIFFDIFWHTIWHLLWHSIWRCAWHHTWHSIVRPQTVWQNVHKWI